MTITGVTSLAAVLLATILASLVYRWLRQAERPRRTAIFGAIYFWCLPWGLWLGAVVAVGALDSAITGDPRSMVWERTMSAVLANGFGFIAAVAAVWAHLIWKYR